MNNDLSLFIDGYQEVFDDPVQASGAVFSSCGKYRHLLWRIWDTNKPVTVFGMLNPSTADAMKNDATIKRCIHRAKTMDHGGLYVFNLFDLRATDPKVMLNHPIPSSQANDGYIKQLITGNFHAVTIGITIAAWGNHGTHMNREAEVLKLIKDAGRRVCCLGFTKEKHPRHPLHLAYSVKPVIWRKS